MSRVEGIFAKRCAVHAGREAAARCPACGGFFCRECVTEHEDRMLCAACLSKSAGAPAGGRGRLGIALMFLQLAAGLAAAWGFFYVVGRILMLVPGAFHEGTF